MKYIFQCLYSIKYTHDSSGKKFIFVRVRVCVCVINDARKYGNWGKIPYFTSYSKTNHRYLNNKSNHRKIKCKWIFIQPLTMPVLCKLRSNGSKSIWKIHLVDKSKNFCMFKRSNKKRLLPEWKMSWQRVRKHFNS